MLAKISNNTVAQYPYTFADLQADFPNTSFPADPDAETLAPFGAVIVAQASPPLTDHTEYAVEQDPELVNGVWTQSWAVIPFTETEMVEKTAQQWTYVRTLRNQTLWECDWTDLPSCPLPALKKQEWADYRTALRNLTENQPDPFNITWPTPPQ